jgi:hypothetical protein
MKNMDSNKLKAWNGAKPSPSWLVRCADVELGLIDCNNRFRHFTAPRPGRREAQEQTWETVTYVPGPNCHL